MDTLSHLFAQIHSSPTLFHWASIIVQACIILFIGFPLLRVIASTIERLVACRFSAQQGMLSAKVVLYSGYTLLGVLFFQQLGFKLTPLLGAAGIVGVAVGFASQTSVSHIISGIFLIAERSFEVGDTITVNGTTGTVLSIDLLSIKLTTADNKFVRIPNESLIKSEVTNVSRFASRKLDLPIPVSIQESPDKIQKLLLDIASRNPRCRVSPAPSVTLDSFTSGTAHYLLTIWVSKEDYAMLKSELLIDIAKSIQTEGVILPPSFPPLTR